MTTRTLQGMAPYPGQARCLALGFWPECFRRLNVKGGRRSCPEETRSALDIEGKHVTLQGSSPDLTYPWQSPTSLWTAVAVGPGVLLGVGVAVTFAVRPLAGRRWVMNTTTYVSPVSGGLARLADQEGLLLSGSCA